MSFKYKDAQISARPLSIGDNDDIGDLLQKLPAEKRTLRMFHFIEFVFAAEVEGELDMPALTAQSTEDDISAAYAAWRKLPRTFLTSWQKELEAVEGSPKA